MLALQTIIDYLAAQPHERVMYFDNFESRHELIATYYQDTEGAIYRTEYERAVNEERKAHIPYERKLSLINYALTTTPLRFLGRAGAVHAFFLEMQKRDEQELYHLAKGKGPFQPDPETYNRYYDGEQRPQDVWWRHQEVVTIEDVPYPTHLVVSPSKTYRDLHTGHSTIIIACPQDYWIERKVIPSNPEHSRHTYAMRRDQYDRLRDDVTLAQGDILQLTYQDSIIARWQLQGDRLLRLPQQEGEQNV